MSTAKPTKQTVSSSSSGVAMSRPTNFAPQRAIAVITSRNATRPRELPECVERAVGVPEHRLQQREVQRQEHVLDDDDAEDQPALGVREPVAARSAAW